ncbi:MAG TPA: hypothetical protein VG826_32105 [Pirellulales bacterium]|nr:hypothetical protein [Pirellulales bacterium]
MGHATGDSIQREQRVRLRLGYALAENPINPNTGSIVDSISQGGAEGIKYLQASLASSISTV